MEVYLYSAMCLHGVDWNNFTFKAGTDSEQHRKFNHKQNLSWDSLWWRNSNIRWRKSQTGDRKKKTKHCNKRLCVEPRHTRHRHDQQGVVNLFIVYFTTLSVGPISDYTTSNGRVNDELKRIWNGQNVAWSKHYPVGNEKSHENLSENSSGDTYRK
jgi:hypothetical protein